MTSARPYAKVVPEKGETRSAIDHLMKIFKDEAKKAETPTDVQRVLQQTAQAQRVQTDEAELDKEWVKIRPIQEGNDKTPRPCPQRHKKVGQQSSKMTKAPP